MNYSPTRLACEAVFEARRKFIIIGLTGRTGSGCTTTAELLSQPNFEKFRAPKPHSSNTFEIDQHRKYNICFNYLNNNWESFYHIKFSNMISNFILEENYENFVKFMKEIKNEFSFSKDFYREFLTHQKKLDSIKKEKTK